MVYTGQGGRGYCLGRREVGRRKVVTDNEVEEGGEREEEKGNGPLVLFLSSRPCARALFMTGSGEVTARYRLLRGL